MNGFIDAIESAIRTALLVGFAFGALSVGAGWALVHFFG